MKIDYLIVATDLSDYSASAARWAHNVKDALGAKIIVSHVVEVSVANWFTSAYESFDNPALHQQAETNLRTWYEDVTGVEPDDVALRLGSPLIQLQELVDELETNDALIVLSTSGKSRVESFFVGSTSRMVASAPPCPVVVVHPDHEYLEHEKPIVVGTDFSQNADKAVEYALRFSRLLDSPVCIVHGNPTPPIAVFDGGEVPVAMLEKSATQWSTSEMARMKERIEALEGVEYETVVVNDSPSRALHDQAERTHANLIFVGHSGESRLVQNVLGSVAQRTLNEPPCTIVIVPHA